MKKISLFVFLTVLSFAGFAQHYNIDSSMASLKMKKDSTLYALKQQRDSSYAAQLHSDTISTDKEYKEKMKWEHLKSVAIFPVFNAGEYSGVIPVKDPTEMADPKMDYKLLFELTNSNPDSLSKEVNSSLIEVARKINLHVAAGVPLKKIFPVIVVHGAGLYVFATNEVYQKKYKTDNPNLKLISELEAQGTRFIACGQAMAFMDIKKEALLAVMKIAVSAQTALSTYQLKGYVLFKLW